MVGSHRSEGLTDPPDDRDARHRPADPLQGILDAERSTATAEVRSALAWRDRVDQESMTVLGALRAAAERGMSACCLMRDGTTHRGHVIAVGPDVIELREHSGRRVFLSLPRVCSLRFPGPRLLASDAEPSAVTLRCCVIILADERAEVRVGLDGGQSEHGTLVACGADVLTLRTTDRELIYVPLSAISEVAMVVG